MNTEVAKGMIRQYEKDGDECWLEQAATEIGFEHDAPVIPEPDFERFYDWMKQEHDQDAFRDNRWDLKKTEYGFIMAFDMVVYELQEVIRKLLDCGFVVASMEAEDMWELPERELYILVEPARNVL